MRRREASASRDARHARRASGVPTAPAPSPASALRVDDFRHAFAAETLYERHGRFPLAYATLQPGLRYAHDARGYIAYARSTRLGRRAAVVLGDPVCAAADAAGLLGDFLAACPGSLFVGASTGTAEHLAAHGLRRNRLGTELLIDPVATGEVPGGAANRPANDGANGGANGGANDGADGGADDGADDGANDGARRGMGDGASDAAAEEMRTPSAVAASSSTARDVAELERTEAVHADLRTLSEAWLRAHGEGYPERRFLNRPLCALDRHQRAFALRSPAGRLQHVVVLDAYRAPGDSVGYRVAIERGLPQAPPNAGPAVLAGALERLRSEGVRTLSLGLVPPRGAERDADEHLYMNVLQSLLEALAPGAAVAPRESAGIDAEPGATRSPLYLVGRNSWSIEYLSALRDVSNHP